MRPQASTKSMSRSLYILFPVVIYFFFVIFSWVTICVLTKRPITTSTYRYNHWIGPKEVRSLHKKNEKWYSAARICQAIVAVSTIPLTSAVCSSAAVVYVQHMTIKSAPNLTLRQMVTLADRGWTDLILLSKLFTRISNWKRYSCLFLFIANLVDIPSKFDDPRPNNAVLTTRKALETVWAYDGLSELWAGNNKSCSTPGDMDESASNGCRQPDLTWGSLLDLQDPYIAQLANGFITGLIRQTVPRINSTAQYKTISEDGFPVDCDSLDWGLSYKYSNFTNNSNGDLAWSVHACMPVDLRISPWKKTRDRQDYSEELFLNITMSEDLWELVDRANSKGPYSRTFRVTVTTTAGYFELPNYMNDRTPGPLMERIPEAFCDEECVYQGSISEDTQDGMEAEQSTQPAKRLSEFDNLDQIPNKGPLLTTAMALFGPGSYLDTYNHPPESYYLSKTNRQTCVDLVPLTRFLTSLDRKFDAFFMQTCVRPMGQFESFDTVAKFLYSFGMDDTVLSHAFTVAAYLANRAWLLELDGSIQSYFSVAYDLGTDSQRPSISQTGMIVISVLMAIYLGALLATTLYATSGRRWTDKLDAFAMMRLGASISEQVPLWIAEEVDEIKTLDETPGWIGDSATEDKTVGQIALGGTTPLRSRRRYVSYERSEEFVEKKKQKKEKRRKRAERNPQALHVGDVVPGWR
ncbi:uncharacterized protein LDX57_010588 [Aspergillus melleus]|uniref:uncharacterized protein n=1 Tax=Aspergillus melleus TaxID=138277 RepID=UPI001E8E6332|nr:uncharacterized protein LDX57_010588 [Aspergillus melleus]KAH8432954.1 hypothetical protein LDX57_010588 [Aspergillus melleus]